MAGHAHSPDIDEASRQEPARDYGRALLYGLLAGIGAAFLWFLAETDFRTVFELFAALTSGGLGEAFAGLLDFATVMLIVLLIGLVLASPTARPFIAFMVWCEPKVALLKNAWAWGLLGLLFALPMPFLMAWPSMPDSNLLSERSLAPLGLYLVCGAIGGLAAWFGYYRPIRSDP